MNPFAKGSVVVLGPEEGELFWQPLPSTGYIVNKLTPYNTPYDSFSLGILSTRSEMMLRCISFVPPAIVHM